MKHRWISLLLVLVMALSLFPAAAFAADGEETSNVNPATGREAGPAGDQRVALMVYGKSVTDALTTAGYSFDAFMAAVASEAQGVLANEKIPDVEVYLVNDANQEYKLEPSDGGDASWINSLKLEASGALGWLEYVLDWLTDLYDWMLGDTSTVGEIYKIYRVDNVPQGDYTLEIRSVGGDGYTVQIPDSGKTRVHVGDEDMNYVGVDEHLGQHTLEVAGLSIWDIHFYAPGIYLNTVAPGIAFTSADLGGHPLPGTEFVMINRDETANIIKAAFALGRETFENAMKLIGSEGFTWKELSILYNEVLQWDSDAMQISLNEANAYKLLQTYWALVSASGKDPLLKFMNADTNIRVPAILKATADNSGVVRFTEDSNVTLVWSLEILIKMGNTALQSDIADEIIEGIEYPDLQTEALVKVIFWIAQYAMKQGAAYWDENSQTISQTINDWIYPLMQNDNLKNYAINAITFIKGEAFVNAHADLLQWLPDHGFLTKKMPAGSYLLFETGVPKGYLKSPLVYTVDLEWHTEEAWPRYWCYGSVASLGILGPAFAEDFYTFLRNNSAASIADDLIGKFTGEPGTMIQDTLSGKADVTAMGIAFGANLIYNHLGGKLVYDSELALAQDLTKYLYTYGRTTQNLLMFASKVAKASESVVTCELTTDWKFYTATTSIRTNLALQVQSVIRGLADSVDTSGQSVIAATAKEILNEMADNLDTTNRIIEETTAIQEEIHETVSNVVSSIASTALKAVVGIGKWLVKMGTRP